MDVAVWRLLRHYCPVYQKPPIPSTAKSRRIDLYISTGCSRQFTHNLCGIQQRSLEQLQTTRRRAEIQIERTAAVLGTIYSQLLTYRSTSRVADYQRLADAVAEEVQRLQDYLEALHVLEKTDKYQTTTP